MVGGVCSACPTGATPERIKLTVSGILCCPGIGNCCPGNDKKKIISQGVGWDFEAILEQGRIFYGPGYEWCANDDICYEQGVVLPCWFSNIKRDDFGSFEVYNLDDLPCSGGVAGVSNFHVRGAHVLISGTPTNRSIQVIIAFGCRPFLIGSTNIWYIFRYIRSYGSSLGAECLPYDQVLENSSDYQGFECPTYCIGNGKAIISKV